FWHDDEIVAKYGQDNLYDEEVSDAELLTTYNPNRDYDFIKLELDDGTVTELKYTSSACMENSDGTITLCFNSMSNPFDASKITAVHVGSAVVPVE
ncbi:MAG: hypothetical protein J6Z29_08955, partial [Ruminococcus sp.]|nr:hypothetical protein [Ruminococcus sp.]